MQVQFSSQSAIAPEERSDADGIHRQVRRERAHGESLLGLAAKMASRAKSESLPEAAPADWIRNDAGDASGWHHHDANDTYVYVIRGSVTIDFGPGGGESVLARAGDFFIVPSQTIHRERTGHGADLEAFVIRVGGEPEHINVDGPDAAGG